MELARSFQTPKVRVDASRRFVAAPPTILAGRRNAFFSVAPIVFLGSWFDSTLDCKMRSHP